MSDHKPDTLLLDDTAYETNLTRKHGMRKRWSPPTRTRSRPTSRGSSSKCT